MPKDHFFDLLLESKFLSHTTKDATGALLCELASKLHVFEDHDYVLKSAAFDTIEKALSTETALPVQPKSWKQALLGPDAANWRKALGKEMSGLMKQGVFDVVDRPPNEIGRAHV